MTAEPGGRILRWGDDAGQRGSCRPFRDCHNVKLTTGDEACNREVQGVKKEIRRAAVSLGQSSNVAMSRGPTRRGKLARMTLAGRNGAAA
jgi:hypothetical protein